MDSTENTVVQGNQLIEGTYNINIDEFRLLNLAISKIDSKLQQPEDPCVITPSEFHQAYGIDTRHVHAKLKTSAKKLLRKPITMYSFDEKRGKTTVTERPWFSIIEYDSSEANHAVKLVFSEFVRPYLYELQRDFTQVKFAYLARLDTPFTIRLYCWLKRSVAMQKAKSHNNTLFVKLDLDWMKQRAGIEGKYSDFRIFRRKLLEPAISRINELTDLSVSFNPIKEGKAIQSIAFEYIVDATPTPNKSEVPKRQRLPRRPHVVAGSHEEGVWARECLRIMSEYRLLLKNMDQDIQVSDLRKMVVWYKIIGDKFSIADIENEISARART